MNKRGELETVDAGADRCETCRFWAEYEEQAEVSKLNPKWVMGSCRRGLRMVQRQIKRYGELELSDSWTWPAHNAGDWCGEWQAGRDTPEG